jgi:hypothetical protein
VARNHTLTVNGLNGPASVPVRIRTPGGVISARGNILGGGTGRTIISLSGADRQGRVARRRQQGVATAMITLDRLE